MSDGEEEEGLDGDDIDWRLWTRGPASGDVVGGDQYLSYQPKNDIDGEPPDIEDYGPTASSGEDALSARTARTVFEVTVGAVEAAAVTT